MGSHTRSRRHGSMGFDVRDAVFLKEHGYSRVPQIVQWMATLRCPLSCPHCLADSHRKGFGDMPADLATDMIDQVAEMGVAEFLVTGGEPLARPDLPMVIEQLSKRKIGWSLNTACMPSAEQKRAMESYPPQFVAVSLDGPREIHDEFRGKPGTFDNALDSIRYFSGLGCPVAAGTTVTSFNFDHLSETFGLVMRSGASNWGIHLPVKEGRAAQRPDLFLSRRQLARLLRFVAAKRNYFPVTMADEFGYCGDWEPLVRDLPMTCGAGRTQCVILPDGSVVPCTTLDRSTSAGNIHERPLREIWEQGFGALRDYKMLGRCAKCDYAVACKGGCWLHRRGGTPCYREIWHVPEAMKSAAGIAVCLGALTCATTSCGNRFSGVDPFVEHIEAAVSQAGGGIDGWIILWYGAQVGPLNIGWNKNWTKAEDRTKHEKFLRRELEEGPKGPLASDPAAKYFMRHVKNDFPKDIEERAKAIQECLGTKERSLALAALLWRDISECCLDGPAPEKRTPAERQAIRETMTALRQTTLAWRKEIFDKKLDPYLARGRTFIPYFYLHGKANPRRPEWTQLTQDTNMERWNGTEPLEGFLERHPYDESMRLKLTIYSPGLALLGKDVEKTLPLTLLFGIHDMLIVPDHVVNVCVQYPLEKLSFRIAYLPAKTELTYVDLLRLIDEWNPEIRGNLNDKNLFCLPSARRMAEELRKQEEEWKDPNEAQLQEPWNMGRGRQQVERWLADFWMF